MTSQKNQFKAVETISYIVSKKDFFFLMQNLGKVLLSLTYFKEAKYLLPLCPPPPPPPPPKKKKKIIPIIIASNVKSNLDAMKKHQELTFSGYPKQVMLHTHPGPSHVLFLALLGVFD